MHYESWVGHYMSSVLEASIVTMLYNGIIIILNILYLIGLSADG